MCAVQNAKDNETLAVDAVKDLVRETASKDAAKAAVVRWEAFWITFQTQQCLREISKEVVTQSRASFIIPVARPA